MLKPPDSEWYFERVGQGTRLEFDFDAEAFVPIPCTIYNVVVGDSMTSGPQEGVGDAFEVLAGDNFDMDDED